eukprot:scaffold83830_cov51-Phaeocystis_antarctica.AAC.1
MELSPDSTAFPLPRPGQTGISTTLFTLPFPPLRGSRELSTTPYRQATGTLGRSDTWGSGGGVSGYGTKHICPRITSIMHQQHKFTHVTSHINHAHAHRGRTDDNTELQSAVSTTQNTTSVHWRHSQRPASPQVPDAGHWPEAGHRPEAGH